MKCPIICSFLPKSCVWFGERRPCGVSDGKGESIENKTVLKRCFKIEMDHETPSGSSRLKVRFYLQERKSPQIFISKHHYMRGWIFFGGVSSSTSVLREFGYEFQRERSVSAHRAQSAFLSTAGAHFGLETQIPTTDPSQPLFLWVFVY